MKKRQTASKTHETGAEQYTEMRMRPFAWNEQDYALMLTEAAAHEHFCDEANAALILLVAGIAAMENDEDRQNMAYFIIERIFSRTQRSSGALKKFMLDWEEKDEIRGYA
ncbi:MAG: hypothetical protein AUG51_19405 [Acidobacteria bacterium 13_1_20CM_3_53_8]|nr:MAG: hypothetical protein AUG51_19405 [Acidobacteria bacterium 13_1_20CM_3_53_8]